MSVESKVRVMQGLIWLNRVLCLVAVVIICTAVVLGEWGVAVVMTVLAGLSLAAQWWARNRRGNWDGDPEGLE